jgi:hypothetical protein
LKISFASEHTIDGMQRRGITEEQVRAVLLKPDREYPGNRGREREISLRNKRAWLRVVYNKGSEADEYVVVTVYPARRPKKGASG